MGRLLGDVAYIRNASKRRIMKGTTDKSGCVNCDSVVHLHGIKARARIKKTTGD